MINFYTLSKQEIAERFKGLEDLSSMVFMRIPGEDIEDQEDYREWLIRDVEIPWMTEFNPQNAESYPRPKLKGIRKGDTNHLFDTERGIWGYFGDFYIGHCKFARYGCVYLSENKSMPDRGLMIEDHYTDTNVIKVHLIADNLQEFLEQEGIAYERVDPKRR